MKKKCVILCASSLFLMFCLPVAARAELIDKYADPVQIVRSGSFETTDHTMMDFGLEGGTLTGARWTVVRHGAIYSLEGTFKEGENVSLSIAGKESPLPDDSGRVFNYMKLELAFLDINYKLIGEKQTYFSGYVKDRTLSSTIGGAIPAGTSQVKISGTFNCRWAGQVVVEEGVAINVTLKPEKAPSSASSATAGSTSKPESTPESTPQPEVTKPASSSAPEGNDAKPSDAGDAMEHAGPLATAVISVIAAIAAVLGGAGSSAAAAATGTGASAAGNEGGPADHQDPAYEKAKVPEYPEYVVSQTGERITKMPNGNIVATHPNGDVETHFPNGTVQVKSPDGSTREEWPDGTISASDSEGFYVKEPDGTIKVREPNGEETEYKPDGTSVETKNSGMKITKNAEGATTQTEHNGFIGTRHPQDPEAVIVTSPHGGNVVIRKEQKYAVTQNSNGKLENQLVDHYVVEGELRSEDAIYKYRPDGSMEYKGDDGSFGTQDKDGNVDLRGADGTTYQKDANGSIKASLPDGTHLDFDNVTGDIDYNSSDGSYMKANGRTGELDAKAADGSYWKRDTKGNGSFYNKENDARGVCREDGSFKIETKEGSITQQADGSMELKTSEGASLIQRADGTHYIRTSDGTIILPDQP